MIFIVTKASKQFADCSEVLGGRCAKHLHTLVTFVPEGGAGSFIAVDLPPAEYCEECRSAQG